MTGDDEGGKLDLTAFPETSTSKSQDFFRCRVLSTTPKLQFCYSSEKFICLFTMTGLYQVLFTLFFIFIAYTHKIQYLSESVHFDSFVFVHYSFQQCIVHKLGTKQIIQLF